MRSGFTQLVMSVLNWNRMTTSILTALVLLVWLQTANGQIYKCKNVKGKITYSESECPSNTKGNVLMVEPNVIDSSDLRRQISNNRTSVQTINTQETVTNMSPDLMTPHQRETRIRELNVNLSDERAFEEKLADARNELGYLKRTASKSLSYELEQTRRNLKVDLNDFDRAKRRKALSALASIYANY